MLVVRTKVLTFKEEKKKAQLQAPRYNSLFKFVPRAQKTNKQKTLPKSALQALDTRAPVSPWFPLSSEQHVCVSASSEPKAPGRSERRGGLEAANSAELQDFRRVGAGGSRKTRLLRAPAAVSRDSRFDR